MYVDNPLTMAAAIQRVADDFTHAVAARGTRALTQEMRQAGVQLRRAMAELDVADRRGSTPVAAYAGDDGRAGSTAETSSHRENDGFAWFHPYPAPSERINRDIDECLVRVSPHFDPHDPQRSNNCVAVATAYELRRRGHDVEAGQIPFPFEDGFPYTITEIAWERRFTALRQRSHLHEAFREPGSRGIVIADWPPTPYIDRGNSHVFNIEHVPGSGIRILDGQPNPPLTDATAHIREAAALRYLRVDDLADPVPSLINYLGIRPAHR